MTNGSVDGTLILWKIEVQEHIKTVTTSDGCAEVKMERDSIVVALDTE